MVKYELLGGKFQVHVAGGDGDGGAAALVDLLVEPTEGIGAARREADKVEVAVALEAALKGELVDDEVLNCLDEVLLILGIVCGRGSVVVERTVVAAPLVLYALVEVVEGVVIARV